METSGEPNVPQTNPRTMIPVLRKLHTKPESEKGGWVGTSNFRRLKNCWINSSQVDPSQFVPSQPPSIPARKSRYFLDGCALEEIQISAAETRISILLHQTLFVTGGWRHPAPPTCCAMQEKTNRKNAYVSPTPLVPVCRNKRPEALLEHQLQTPTESKNL